MSDLELTQKGTPFSATGVGTTAGVTVSQAGVASRIHVGTQISGSGDAAALITVESPAATVLWRKRFAAAFSFSEDVHCRGAVAAVLNLKISASTANCEANLSGYTVTG